MYTDLSGVICATLTPFTSDTGPVDYAWIPQHLRYLEAQGVNGVLAMGTTGEGPSLSLAERKEVLAQIIQHRGDLFVLACTGCATLAETIDLSGYALEQGVAALLVMPPFYFKQVPDAGLLSYFRTLCDALPDDARVLLYHIPAVTGVPIRPEVISGLLESHPHKLYGLKDSSGDERYLLMVRRDYPQLHIYVGNELVAAPGLAEGAIGIISAIANAFPTTVVDVWQSYKQNGDAVSVQARLTALTRLLAGNTPPALKMALTWTSDLPRTSVRVPLANLSEPDSRHLYRCLADLALIT